MFIILAGQPIRIWILGDSHIRRAADRARQTLGYNLGLANVAIWWKGHGGAKLGDVEDLIYEVRFRHAPPDIVIVHLGTNDFGDGNSAHIHAETLDALNRIRFLLSNTAVILSQILDRLFFHGAADQQRIRQRLRACNRGMRRAAVRYGTRVITHPEIQGNDHNTFLWDCLHLSDTGYEYFISRIASGIRYFMTYPWEFFY